MSFRRLITACGAFVIAFETASTLVFIFECTPIRDFWVTFGGAYTAKLGGRCINFIKFLEVNGSINTVTDFALLLLVGALSSKDHPTVLIRVKAHADTMAFASKRSAKVYPDRHLHHWFGVSSAINIFSSPEEFRLTSTCSVTAVSMVRIIVISRYHGQDVTCE